MIPEQLKKYIDELIDSTLKEMDGGTSTTASAGGEYTGKYAFGKADISTYTKDGFKKVKPGMPSDSKIYDYKQFPSKPEPKRYKLYKESNLKEVSQEAYTIHRFTNAGQNAAQDFIDDNKIDGEKLVKFLKRTDNEGLKNRYMVRDIIGGQTDNDTKQKFIKSFKKSTLKEMVKEELLNEISYRRFAENVSKVTPERKLVRALQEVSKRIREIEQVIEYSNRLKTENTIKKESFWTSKTEQLDTLSERLNALSNKIRTLSK